MTQPVARTWGRRGCAPVVRVRGRSRRGVSIAALACCKPGERSRLIYRPRRDDPAGGRNSFAWRDYRYVLTAARQQLGGPIVLVWDNLTVHEAAGMREFAASHDWLTIFYLPRTHRTSTPWRASGPCCDVAGFPTSPSPPPDT
ncbi:hypothetical protein STBA_19520 [Streptomyces sp. MP131-18]|nr:hypothetical protein STBA_19520 [Streptomyces sp. MP131-18]